MAGEYCGRRCAWCGRCDAEPDDRCDCGRAECGGECTDAVEAHNVVCRNSEAWPGWAGVCGVDGLLHSPESLHCPQVEARTSTTYDLDDITDINPPEAAQ